MEKKNKIIVLQGMPACGKSTWAKDYVAVADTNTVIVCRDTIRVELGGGVYSMDHEKEVTAREESDIRNAISNGSDVIIDATNLNPKTIDKWNNLAAELGCDIEFKKLDVTLEVAISRDKLRGENGGRSVGEEVIRRFYYRYIKNAPKYVNHKRVPIDKTLPPCVICDIDGTIAWINGRSPYDTKSVLNDNVDPRMSQLLSWMMFNGMTVLFVSGREGTDQCKRDTIAWLEKHLKDYKVTKMSGTYSRFDLLMRKEKDFRPDEVVKKEIYEKYIKPNYDVICVFDDRNKVVNMWREEGMLCCQVAEGNF